MRLTIGSAWITAQVVLGIIFIAWVVRIVTEPPVYVSSTPLGPFIAAPGFQWAGFAWFDLATLALGGTVLIGRALRK